MRIVFATGNNDKLKEIREILDTLNIEIISMKEAGVFEDVEENGKTFAENSMIKATSIAQIIKDKFPEEAKETIVLADDSGLEIDYLNGEPGVYSARYMGKETSYTEKNNNLIERLNGVPDSERTARFVCAISAVLPDGKELSTVGTMEGIIGYEIKRIRLRSYLLSSRVQEDKCGDFCG